MKNDKKIAVISGASSGIGLATAKQLAQMGNFVFAGARKAGDIANLTALENVQGVRLDITRNENEAIIEAIGEPPDGVSRRSVAEAQAVLIELGGK